MIPSKVTDIWHHKKTVVQNIPLFISRISAGIPFPADSTIDQKIDLNEFLIQNSTATFFVRVEGTSMIDAGIHPGDLLVVDKSIDPLPNNIVIAVVDGEFLVKRYITEHGVPYLIADNPSCGRVDLKEGMQVELWGVVKYAIHKAL